MRWSHNTQAQSTASHCHLLAPRESDCSLMHSKVFFAWLSRYLKATLTVLEIFKRVEYFPDNSRRSVIILLPMVFCDDNKYGLFLMHNFGYYCVFENSSKGLSCT
jgi:hypothetical protein